MDYNWFMADFIPYYTQDGSVGLYSNEFNDIYHSVFGACVWACRTDADKDGADQGGRDYSGGEKVFKGHQCRSQKNMRAVGQNDSAEHFARWISFLGGFWSVWTTIQKTTRNFGLSIDKKTTLWYIVYIL